MYLQMQIYVGPKVYKKQVLSKKKAQWKEPDLFCDFSSFYDSLVQNWYRAGTWRGPFF